MRVRRVGRDLIWHRGGLGHGTESVVYRLAILLEHPDQKLRGFDLGL
jgi:hypothetical protein